MCVCERIPERELAGDVCVCDTEITADVQQKLVNCRELRESAADILRSAWAMHPDPGVFMYEYSPASKAGPIRVRMHVIWLLF